MPAASRQLEETHSWRLLKTLTITSSLPVDKSNQAAWKSQIKGVIFSRGKFAKMYVYNKGKTNQS